MENKTKFSSNSLEIILLSSTEILVQSKGVELRRSRVVCKKFESEIEGELKRPELLLPLGLQRRLQSWFMYSSSLFVLEG